MNSSEKQSFSENEEKRNETRSKKSNTIRGKYNPRKEEKERERKREILAKEAKTDQNKLFFFLPA